MAVFNNLIPYFIHERFKEEQSSGTLQAVTLFMDISGSTALTQTMMGHGKRGAEILSHILNRIFDPVIQAVYAHGGFVTGFAGDAFTAVFPLDKENVLREVLLAAETIRQVIWAQSQQTTPLGSFVLEGRVGLSVGEVTWGIVGPGAHLAYFFRGAAIEDGGMAENQAKNGQVVVNAHLGGLLAAEKVVLTPIGEGFSRLQDKPFPGWSRFRKKSVPHLPALEPRIVGRFFPPRLFERPLQGEFRSAAIIFIGFERDLPLATLQVFANLALLTADRLGGHFSEIEFDHKGGVILLYFGAPVGHENDLKRALNFVMTFRQRLEETLLQVKWRSGITFGPVYAGLTGTPYRGKYSLLGATVNFAARLMEQAQWGEILVGEMVTGEFRDFVFEKIGELPYKGFASPVATFRFLGARPMAGAEDGLERVALSQMVGREQELRALIDAAEPIFHRYSAGLAVVYGEPGMGKSQLLHALYRALGNRVTWLTAQNDQILRQSFGPFIHLLKQYFRQLPDNSPEFNQIAFDEKFRLLIGQLQDRANTTDSPSQRASLNLLLSTLAQKKAFLEALAGVHLPGTLYDTLDERSRFQNNLLAIKTLIIAESRLRPVVLAIEDANRLDDASQEMLNFLTINTSHYPLFIVVTARYEEDGSRPVVKYDSSLQPLVLDLKEFTEENLRLLAKDILDDSVDERLLRVLQEKTHGNPFFAQQVLYYFRENGLIQPHAINEKIRWELQSLPTEALPASVQPILTAQIDRLAPALREAVMVASVLGRVFDIQVLSFLLDKEALSLAEAGEKEQIWETVNGQQYTFRHELLRDAAYKIQLESRLRELHRHALRAYETLFPDTLSRFYSSLVYHAQEGWDEEKETLYTALAGEQAAARFAPAEALSYLSRALELTHPNDLSTRYRFLTIQEKMYALLGDREAQRYTLQRLAEIVQALDDPYAQAELALLWANYWEALSNYPALHDAIQQAIQLAHQKAPEAPHTQRLVAQSHLIWARYLLDLSDYPLARTHLTHTLGIFQHLGDELETAQALHMLGTCASYQGQYASALQHYREALFLYRKIGHRQGEAHILNNLGTVAADMGDPAEEKAYYEQALHIRQEIGDRLGEADTLNNLGLSERSLGNYARAHDFYVQALEIYYETKNRMGEQLILHNLGETFYYLKMYQEAIASYRQALFLARQLKDREGEALNLFHMGNVLRDNGNLDLAEKHYHQALSLHRELGRTQYEPEDLAALADVALLKQNLPQAMHYLHEITPLLMQNPTLDGSEEPFRVYLTCYHVLTETQAPAAHSLLERAHTLLTSRAARILDPDMHRKFLENNPWHREVLALWEKEKK
ncbi:MAG: tetratricopeptide repeat protein [Anaerolineales bacterium]|nr:tetratricopeptide repeat protein [Anaerolineales bacterium]